MCRFSGFLFECQKPLILIKFEEKNTYGNRERVCLKDAIEMHNSTTPIRQLISESAFESLLYILYIGLEAKST